MASSASLVRDDAPPGQCVASQRAGWTSGLSSAPGSHHAANPGFWHNLRLPRSVYPRSRLSRRAGGRESESHRREDLNATAGHESRCSIRASGLQYIRSETSEKVSAPCGALFSSRRFVAGPMAARISNRSALALSQARERPPYWWIRGLANASVVFCPLPRWLFQRSEKATLRSRIR